MNPNYCHTITLYNCLKARDAPGKREKWIRTVLHECFYKSEIKTVSNGEQVSKVNAYVVRIPESPDYQRYSLWKENMGGFTVSEKDIVILGECLEEITGEPGRSATDVLLRYKPDAFRVNAFADNTSHMAGRHYRLEG